MKPILPILRYINKIQRDGWVIHIKAKHIRDTSILLDIADFNEPALLSVDNLDINHPLYKIQLGIYGLVSPKMSVFYNTKTDGKRIYSDIVSNYTYLWEH